MGHFKMRFLLVLTSTFVALSSAKDCLSDGFNKRCLPKSEAGPFGFLYKGGDPCFKRNGKNFCLVDVGAGMLPPCTCTSECGCSGETVHPPLLVLQTSLQKLKIAQIKISTAH